MITETGDTEQDHLAQAQINLATGWRTVRFILTTSPAFAGL